jgi:V/A-type H+-transporting ATPase subunit E
MTTIEDKIKLFTKIIYEKIDEENSEAASRFQEEKEQKLEQLRIYMKGKREQVLTETAKKAEIKCSEMISAQKIRSKQRILELKQNIISETIELVKNRFREFVASDEYKEYLLDLLGCYMPKINEGDYNIYFAQNDLRNYGNDIKSTLNKYNIKVEIKESNYDIIGGFLIENKAGKYRIDCSFTTVIQDNKELAALKCMKISL